MKYWTRHVKMKYWTSHVIGWNIELDMLGWNIELDMLRWNIELDMLGWNIGSYVFYSGRPIQYTEKDWVRRKVLHYPLQMI